MQMYYCSLILVYLHRPLLGGMDEYLERQANLQKYSKFVCGISSTLTDYASSIMSSQCLFIGKHLSVQEVLSMLCNKGC